MMPQTMTFDALLPVIFVGLMAVAMLAYVILDGYDLGVGALLGLADDDQKDTMIDSIGPFWDANETWLVMGVGLLLVAFPKAHGVILSSLYLPVALMLAGLTLRGVAFDFRVKAKAHHKPWWNTAFSVGSVLAAFSQGMMLGLFILGFEQSTAAYAFAAFVGCGLTAGYALLGAGWLIMKTEGALQTRAVLWARVSLVVAALGVVIISVATPLVSPRVFDKWFSLPNFVLLAPIPLMTAVVFVVLERLLKVLPLPQDRLCWAPFAGVVAIFVLAFYGLAYSLFPFLVVDRLTIWQAAAAPESLKVVLAGAVLVLPTIAIYTALAYRVFWGKTRPLGYA